MLEGTCKTHKMSNQPCHSYPIKDLQKLNFNFLFTTGAVLIAEKFIFGTRTKEKCCKKSCERKEIVEVAETMEN